LPSADGAPAVAVGRERGAGRSAPNGAPAARIRDRLAAPVDGASVAVFRIAFFGIIACEVARYFAHGWIREYWIDPTFHFTYFDLGWVRPWPGVGMYVHFGALGCLALLAAAGVWYRPAAILVWLGFTYQFLLDEARYLNHFYAASLFALLLAVIPADAAWAFHRGAGWRKQSDGAAKPAGAGTVPTWAVWLLRAQVGTIYAFAGLAKLNGDWLHGEPMRSWLLDKARMPVIGAIVHYGWGLALFSYGGLFFDLLVVPGLLWRRTRPAAFAVAVVFHLLNSQLFTIGIFPWMMIAATTIFFDPAWPRSLRVALRRRWRPEREAGPRTPPAAGTPVLPSTSIAGRGGALSLGATWVLAFYVAIQVGVPLRHFLYPGNVAWTEEGHRFSWRMMLREKTGTARFFVRTPRGQVTVNPRDSLTAWQYDELVAHPDMVLQFAHHLADDWRAQGIDRVEVRARVMASLDSHRQLPLVDSTVDLAAQPRTLGHERWVTAGP